MNNFTGYGVMVGEEMVYSDYSLSLCEAVRDREHPSGTLVKWVQSPQGGPTVYEVIS